MTLLNGPAGIEECEDNDCSGCPWCDALGITVEPIEAIGRLLDAHDHDESFKLDAEQVLERIAAIVDHARRTADTEQCELATLAALDGKSGSESLAVIEAGMAPVYAANLRSIVADIEATEASGRQQSLMNQAIEAGSYTATALSAMAAWLGASGDAEGHAMVTAWSALMARHEAVRL